MNLSDSKFWRDDKERLDKASPYIIGKREVPVFVTRKEISNKHLLIIDVEVGKAYFHIFISVLKNKKYSLDVFYRNNNTTGGIGESSEIAVVCF